VGGGVLVFIPIECENIICLSDVVALYREGNVTKILRADGSSDVTLFTPPTLKRRGEALWNKSAVSPERHLAEELRIDG